MTDEANCSSFRMLCLHDIRVIGVQFSLRHLANSRLDRAALAYMYSWAYPAHPPPTHNREPYDTLLYGPTSCPYRSVCGTDAACSSNTIRDSISRVAPSLRGPRSAPALRHARRPCALTRGRPAVPRRPGTGRSRRTARRAALAPRPAPHAASHHSRARLTMDAVFITTYVVTFDSIRQGGPTRTSADASVPRLAGFSLIT